MIWRSRERSYCGNLATNPVLAGASRAGLLGLA